MSSFYQIIPLTRLSGLKTSAQTSAFTYQFSEKIPWGSVVQIPFGRQIVRGVVIKELKQRPRQLPRLLKIKKVITPAQLEKSQLALAEKVSAYYLTPLSVTLKFFLPSLTKRPAANLPTLTPPWPTKKAPHISLTDAQKQAVTTLRQKWTKPVLLFGPPSAGKTEVAIELIKQALAADHQVLVLIPEIFLSYQEILRYQQRLPEYADTTAIFHSQLRPSEITAIWRGLQTKKVKLVIGTRSAVFLPFVNPGLVIIDEEQDLSHKQWDTPPFYRSNQVAAWWSEAYRRPVPVVSLSATPSLTAYHRQEKVVLPPLQLPTQRLKPPRIELVDLKKHYRWQKPIIITPPLKQALRQVRERKQTALLLVPRRGRSSFLVCQDCREIPLCPDCQTPLVHQGSFYRCLHCRFKISEISRCPHCHGFRLRDFGFGTESVAEELQKIFPEARLAIADGTTFADNEYRQKLLAQLLNNEVDLVVGTYAIAKGLDIPHINLVAILNADNWPGQSDFRFDEHYLSTLFQFAGRLNRPGGRQDGLCLIQTFNPGNRLFSFLQKWNWAEFADYELNNRRALKYPPFSHLLKITYRHRQKEKVEKEIDRLHRRLQDYLTTYQSSTTVLPPYDGFLRQLRGYHQKHLLLKTPSLPLTDAGLLKLLALPTGWKIDVDTESIF